MTRKEEVVRELKKNYKPVEGGKKYTIDFFKPEDAMGVISCCYSIYGDGYPVDIYYNPEELIKASENGSRYSVVARTDEGEILGYVALYKSSAPYENFYEIGQCIVLKEYRGSRIAYSINLKILNYAKELGLDALYVESVTNHIITQKFGERFGFITTALEIDLMPAEGYENDDMVAGRVSTIFQLLINKDKPQKIYIPKIYQDVLLTTIDAMANLKREISISEEQNLTTLKQESVIKIEKYDFAGVIRVSVKKIGKNIEKELRKIEKEMETMNYKVLQFFLPLTDENTPFLIKILNDSGFFYGGYLPRWFGDDAFFLQKLYTEPTFKNINLYPDTTYKLLDYIKSDYFRTK